MPLGMSVRSQVPCPGVVGASGIMGYGKRGGANQELQPNSLGVNSFHIPIIENTQFQYDTGNSNWITTGIPASVKAYGNHRVEITIVTTSGTYQSFTVYLVFRINTDGSLSNTSMYSIGHNSSGRWYIGTTASSNGKIVFHFGAGLVGQYILSVKYIPQLYPIGYANQFVNSSNIIPSDWVSGWAISNDHGGFPSNPVEFTYQIGVVGTFLTQIAGSLGMAITGAASSFGTSSAPQLLQVNGYEVTAEIALSLSRRFG